MLFREEASAGRKLYHFSCLLSHNVQSSTVSRWEMPMFERARDAFRRLGAAMAQRWAAAGAAWRKTRDYLRGTTLGLSYFHQVLAVELEAINHRRRLISESERGRGPRGERGQVRALVPDASTLPTPRRTPRASGDPDNPKL